jgi:hypothetical protein
MNLRDLRSRLSGVLPEGMPTYLAFFTDCARYLFGKSTARGLFFRLGDPYILTNLKKLLYTSRCLPPTGR